MYVSPLYSHSSADINVVLEKLPATENAIDQEKTSISTSVHTLIPANTTVNYASAFIAHTDEYNPDMVTYLLINKSYQ